MAVKTGDPVDYTRCDAKLAAKWVNAESIPMCPTTGDQTEVRNQIATDADFIVLKLTGVRFVDNGDGTVTDMETGLMWEKKESLDDVANLANPHDADNTYSWNTTIGGTTPSGTAFTDFLGKLNNCTFDLSSYAGGFAGYCDWRLPTFAELLTIMLPIPYPCTDGMGPAPCIYPEFGETALSGYWSSTTWFFNASDAWAADFDNGGGGYGGKDSSEYVRAVRRGL
jgi:hypothetical protein